MENIRLSIIIPARNEVYLNRTIKDLQDKATGDIEIIVVLDGYDVEVGTVIVPGS